jgi:hypothetical protein
LALLPLMSAHYRRCRLLLLLLVPLAIVDVIADVDAPCTCLVLLSEFDTAGHTDALEIPLLLSSDVVTADVELDQRPAIPDADSEFLGKPWSILAASVTQVVIAGDIKLSEDRISLQRICKDLPRRFVEEAIALQ